LEQRAARSAGSFSGTASLSFTRTSVLLPADDDDDDDELDTDVLFEAHYKQKADNLRPGRFMTDVEAAFDFLSPFALVADDVPQWIRETFGILYGVPLWFPTRENPALFALIAIVTRQQRVQSQVFDVIAASFPLKSRKLIQELCELARGNPRYALTAVSAVLNVPATKLRFAQSFAYPDAAADKTPLHCVQYDASTERFVVAKPAINYLALLQTLVNGDLFGLLKYALFIPPGADANALLAETAAAAGTVGVPLPSISLKTQLGELAFRAIRVWMPADYTSVGTNRGTTVRKVITSVFGANISEDDANSHVAAAAVMRLTEHLLLPKLMAIIRREIPSAEPPVRLLMGCFYLARCDFEHAQREFLQFCDGDARQAAAVRIGILVARVIVQDGAVNDPDACISVVTSMLRVAPDLLHSIPHVHDVLEERFGCFFYRDGVAKLSSPVTVDARHRTNDVVMEDVPSPNDKGLVTGKPSIPPIQPNMDDDTRQRALDAVADQYEGMFHLLVHVVPLFVDLLPMLRDATELDVVDAVAASALPSPQSYDGRASPGLVPTTATGAFSSDIIRRMGEAILAIVAAGTPPVQPLRELVTGPAAEFASKLTEAMHAVAGGQSELPDIIDMILDLLLAGLDLRKACMQTLATLREQLKSAQAKAEPKAKATASGGSTTKPSRGDAVTKLQADKRVTAGEARLLEYASSISDLVRLADQWDASQLDQVAQYLRSARQLSKVIDEEYTNGVRGPQLVLAVLSRGIGGGVSDGSIASDAAALKFPSRTASSGGATVSASAQERVWLLVRLSQGDFDVVPMILKSAGVEVPAERIAQFGRVVRTVNTIKAVSSTRKLADMGPSDLVEMFARQIFAELDVDNSGALAYDEFLLALEKMHLDLSEHEARMWFTTLDTNKSGGITEDEFLNAMRKIRERFLFRMLDRLRLSREMIYVAIIWTALILVMMISFLIMGVYGFSDGSSFTAVVTASMPLIGSIVCTVQDPARMQMVLARIDAYVETFFGFLAEQKRQAEAAGLIQ
jgi:hypothetical protein